MGDGFHVDLNALTRLAGTMADQQKTVAAAGGPMQDRAEQVDTGDPGLDAETRSLVKQVNDVLKQLADGFTGIGQGLDEAADAYRSFDAQAADGYQQLMPADDAGADPDTPVA